MRLHLPIAALALIMTACAHSAPPAQNAKHATTSNTTTITITAPANYTEHSYRGTPDLGLTLALVQAGGGPSHFSSARLFKTLAGSNARAEEAKLQRLYGKARLAAFMQTFDFAVRDLVSLFALNHIALPPGARVSPQNGRALTIAMYRDGVMPTGKYDCGYFMEHLMTHPVHIALMHDINVAHGHGPAHNANFHIVLTRMLADLRNMYTGNGKST
jgi:hypothetical protein